MQNLGDFNYEAILSLITSNYRCEIAGKALHFHVIHRKKVPQQICQLVEKN